MFSADIQLLDVSYCRIVSLKLQFAAHKCTVKYESCTHLFAYIYPAETSGRIQNQARAFLLLLLQRRATRSLNGHIWLVIYHDLFHYYGLLSFPQLC